MYKNPAITILRWGLAFVFFYAAIASLLNPSEWIGYLPGFLTVFLPPRLVLTVFSIYEIILAALLFMGKKLVWISLLSVITLAAIVVFNLGLLEVTFRDVGLAMAALALYELARAENRIKGNAGDE